jgi:hypothetical protein
MPGRDRARHSSHNVEVGDTFNLQDFLSYFSQLRQFDAHPLPDPVGGWIVAALLVAVLAAGMAFRCRAQRTRRRILERVDQALARGESVLSEYREYVDRCVASETVPLEPAELYRVRKAMQALKEIQKKYR